MRKICIVLSVFVSSLLSVQAFAEAEIIFSQKELDAAFTLIRPELIALDISGRSGTLVPSPALKYLGIDTLKFDIALNSIVNIVDLQFNHIRNKPFQIQFQDQGLVLTVPIQDQEKAIHSTLGSISFQGVTLVGVVGTQTSSNGSQQIVLKDVNLNGTLKGTGILKGPLILKKVRELMVKMLADQLNKVLEKDTVQSSVRNGLISWSKFYTGESFFDIVPGTVQIGRAGIQYQVEH